MWFFSRMSSVLQASLLGTPLSSFSGRLPKWGSMRSGDIFALVTSVRHTSGSDGSAWPTAQATKGTYDFNWKATDGRTKPNKLGWAIRHWSTPAANEPALERRAKHGQHIQTQNGTVRRVNPDGTQSNLGLNAQVNWATPTQQDGENTAGPSQFNRNSQPLNVQAVSAPGQALNPAWVEILQGYPPGWTDIGE